MPSSAVSTVLRYLSDADVFAKLSQLRPGTFSSHGGAVATALITPLSQRPHLGIALPQLLLLPTPGQLLGSLSMLVRRDDAPPALLVVDLCYSVEMPMQDRFPGAGDKEHTTPALQTDSSEREVSSRERPAWRRRSILSWRKQTTIRRASLGFSLCAGSER